MADLVITAANVKPQTGAVLAEDNNAGETITAGQVVRLDGTLLKWKLLDANADEAATEKIGIATHAALLDQPLAVIISGDLALGSILTAGRLYVASANSGGIAPVADLGVDMYTILLGYAKDSSMLKVQIVQSGIKHA